MLPKFLKKGMLCLAFAAAVGGLAGCNRNPSNDPTATDPKIDYDAPIMTFTPAQRDVRSDALQAETFQVRTEYYGKLLASKKITQAEFDEVKKDDDNRIAGLRNTYAGTIDILFFDGFFHHELKKHGFPVPEKMPELPKPAAATTPPAPAPGAPKVK